MGLLKRGRLELGRSAGQTKKSAKSNLHEEDWYSPSAERRKRKREENETSVNIGQSEIHDSDGETGRKSGKKNGGAAKRINVVVMHEEDGKR